MNKRIFSTILCIIMLLPIVILATVPAVAAEADPIDLTFEPQYFFRKYSDGSIIVSTSTTVINNEKIAIQVPNDTMVYLSIAYGLSINDIADDVMFKAGYTYNISYDIGFLTNVPYSHGYLEKIAVGSDISEFRTLATDPLNYSKTLDSYVNDFNYSYIFDSSTNIGTLKFVFNCLEDITTNDFYFISPLFFFYTNSGEGTTLTYSVGFECEGYYDLDLSIYEHLILKNQTSIENAIVSGFQETNSSLNEIKDVLTGDGDYTFEKNDELQSSIKENAALEEEIYDSILNNTVELPNGDTISTDSLNFNDVYLSIEQTYNAPVFEEDMAAQIDKFFDIFMPYLGTVIFLSLTLGLCIAFLTGRRLL